MPTQELASFPSSAPQARNAPNNPLTAGERAMRRAERQAQRGRFLEAITSLEAAIAAGADAYECCLQMADLYCALQQWPSALAAAERALSLDPAEAPAYEMIMTLALETADFERAIHAGRALLKLMPHHITAHDTLEVAYIQLGDVDAAMRVLNAQIRQEPESAAHRFKKGLLCQHKGEVSLAVQEFSEAIALDPVGPHGDAARDALDALDTFQLNQILLLAMEDLVFRVKLSRNAPQAACERGYTLSETGQQILCEICQLTLPEFPEPCRLTRYN